MPDVRKTGRTRQLAIDSTIIAVVAVVGLAVVYQLWDASLGVPFGYLSPDRSPLVYAPDSFFYLMMSKGSIDHFWFLDNPSLGYPFGQQLHEIPHGLDNLNLAILQSVDTSTLQSANQPKSTPLHGYRERFPSTT